LPTYIIIIIIIIITSRSRTVTMTRQDLATALVIALLATSSPCLSSQEIIDAEPRDLRNRTATNTESIKRKLSEDPRSPTNANETLKPLEPPGIVDETTKETITDETVDSEDDQELLLSEPVEEMENESLNETVGVTTENATRQTDTVEELVEPKDESDLLEGATKEGPDDTVDSEEDQKLAEPVEEKENESLNETSDVTAENATRQTDTAEKLVDRKDESDTLEDTVDSQGDQKPAEPVEEMENESLDETSDVTTEDAFPKHEAVEKSVEPALSERKVSNERTEDTTGEGSSTLGASTVGEETYTMEEESSKIGASVLEKGADPTGEEIPVVGASLLEEKVDTTGEESPSLGGESAVEEESEQTGSSPLNTTGKEGREDVAENGIQLDEDPKNDDSEDDVIDLDTIYDTHEPDTATEKSAGESSKKPIAVETEESSTSSQSKEAVDIRDPEKLESVDEETKKPAPKGSLASFFEKVSDKQKKPASTGGLEGRTSFESLAQQAEEINDIENAQQLPPSKKVSPWGDIQDAQQLPLSKNIDENPEYSGSPWGLCQSQKNMPDMDLLYLVFKDRIRKELGIPLEASYKEAIFPLGVGSEDEVEIVGSAQDIPIESDFEGLDDIDKFFEGVDPPDELDIGAGSSMQDVLMQKGSRILVKRVKLGVRFLRRVVSAMKAKLSKRFTTEDGKFTITQQDLKEAAMGIWVTSRKVVQKIFDLVDDLIEGGDEDDDDGALNLDAIRMVRGDPMLARNLEAFQEAKEESGTSGNIS
jgi:hypothetical protein